MGTHIRDFRKVTPAVPNSRQAHVRLAGRSCQPKGVWLRSWMLLFWGVLIWEMLYSHRKKHWPLAGKAVLVTWDRRWCSAEGVSHIQANPQLSREHTTVLVVHKHMDAWACFPQEGEPSLPGWVNVDCHWSIPENGSFCFYGSFLECGNTYVEFFFIWTEKVFIQQHVSRLKWDSGQAASEAGWFTWEWKVSSKGKEEEFLLLKHWKCC